MAEPSSLDARALLTAAYPVGTLVDGRDVLAVRVPAGTALEAWGLLKVLHDETGFWPFLTDPTRDERMSTVWENFADYRQVANEDAVLGDVAQLFTRWQAEYLEVDEDDPFYGEEDHAALVASRGFGSLTLPAEPARGNSWAAATTEIGLCPARPGGIEIPHLMEWSGACNYGITGAEHEAVLGHWRWQYGAELLTLAFDVIELAVPRPPTDPTDVALVAREQTAYCPDIVDQGVGTIVALAKQQVYSHKWFFWWTNHLTPTSSLTPTGLAKEAIDVPLVIPAPFRGSWCASDLGDYRPCEYTYERYAIDSIPPLDEGTFTGDFAWFGDVGHVRQDRAEEMDRLASDLAVHGVRLPADFVALQTRAELYLSLDDASGTGCWTNISPPLDSPLEPDDRMVRFFRDQQDCVMWYLYLRSSGESFVVHSYRDIEFEAEIRAGGDPEEIEDLPDYDHDPDYEIFWCAPTVEAFTYRVLIEGSIQHALANGRDFDDLDPRQQSYLSHYLTNPSQGHSVLP